MQPQILNYSPEEVKNNDEEEIATTITAIRPKSDWTIEMPRIQFNSPSDDEESSEFCGSQVQ